MTPPSSLLLHCLIIDDIALDHCKFPGRNVIGLQVFTDCHDGILIQICSKYLTGA